MSAAEVRSLGQVGADGVDALLGCKDGGVDDVVCEPEVVRAAEVEAFAGAVGVGEDGTVCGLKEAAVVEGGEGGVEEDGVGAGSLLEEETVGELLGRAAAEGEDDVMHGEGGGERGGLEAAEVVFAVAGEELGDGGVGAGFEVGVEVYEVPAEARGEEAADGGFTCAHETGEDETAVEEVGGRGDGWLESFGGRHTVS